MIFDVSQSLSEFFWRYSEIFLGISWVILITGVLQNAIYMVQLPVAWKELRKQSQAGDMESDWQLLISNVTLPISLIIPAHNEESCIVQSVQSMLALEYPDFEVIVVNDGSADRTLSILAKAFSLKLTQRAWNPVVPHKPVKGVYRSEIYTNLIVVDKESGGSKADASNAGINFSRNPLFCVVDADSILETKALLRSVRPFLEDPRHMVAVGGTIRILNGCEIQNGQVIRVGLPKNFLALVQVVEYIRAFLMGRLAWSRWGLLSIISGAFGIFKRSVAVEVGGYSLGTVGEDYELIIKMHRYLIENKRSYSMRYVPEPVCWTEGPETLKALSSQRKRWQRGALEVFFKHVRMFLNFRYGRMGTLALPYSFLVDVFSPIAEVLGYLLVPLFWWAGVLNTHFMLAFIATFFIFGVFISVGSLVLEEMELQRFPRARDLAIIGLVAVVENFGYRQLCNFWRVAGYYQFLRKTKGWGSLERKGVVPA
ncbi:MAG: glycosyltransferase [Bdellovibrionales bacterium]